MTHQVGAQSKHAESRLSGKSIARIARVIVILLVSFFGATTAAHAFGAIAYGTFGDDNRDIAGISNNQPTPQEARAAAIQNCNNNAAGFSDYENDCSVRAGYFGQHVNVYGLRIVSTRSFLGLGISADAARSAAIESCEGIVAPNVMTLCESFYPTSVPGVIGNGTYILIAEDTITTCPTGQNLNEGDVSDTTDDTCECPGDTTANDQGNCACPDGQESSGGDSCTACTGNEVSMGGNSCTACTGDMVPNSGKTSCESCPSGMMPNGDNSACICPDGQESDGSNSCTACTGNEVSMGGADCQPCTGEMVPNSEKTECEACTGGMIPNSDSSACICPDGQESDGSNSCTACTGNQFSMGGADCQSCTGEMVPNSGKTSCESCPSGMMPNDNNSACICPDGQTENADGNCVTASLNCAGDKIPNAANDECVCPTGQTDEDNNNTCECPTGQTKNSSGTCETTSLNCSGGQMPNADNSACECPSGLETYRVGTLNICGEQLSDETGEYTSDNCRAQGWMREFARDNNNIIVAELCLIQYEIILSTVSANTLGEASPLVLDVGGSADSCIIRQHTGYQNTELSNCAAVFGTGGEFPSVSIRGESEGRLRVALNSSGGPSNVSPPTEPTTEPTPMVSSVSPTTDSEFDTKQFLYLGSAVGAIVLLWQYNSPEGLVWNWTPSAEFQHHNGESFYTYGSKFDYESGNWSGYWQAAQTQSGGNSGDWIYGTGTAWTGDVFAASLRNTTQGLESDTEFALSARKEFGVWTVESSYTADLEVQNLNEVWKNKLSIGASIVYDKWQVSPSAALSWEHNESIGNNAGFRLDLRREL